MPTVEFSLQDLNELLGREVTIDELEDEYILYVKGEVEYFDGDTVKCDMKDTNRPDLWSIEGIARELRGHLGIEDGPAKFDLKDSGIEMKVDKKVEKVRAKTVAAVVKGLTFTDEIIKQTIQLQEKIAMTYGRNRDLAAIGVYDFDKIVPPVIYTTVPPDGIKFVPLDFEEEMTPAEILERHPKGREYGHLIEKYEEYPLMIDSAGNVLSIPPIINSVYTGKVTEETRNVFIEITGHEIKRILVALNVLTTALAERGGEIQTVKVTYHDQTIVTPDLSLQEHEVDPEYCRRHLGLDLTDEEIAGLLRKARYDALVENGRIIARAPGYRNDIMHPADIVEDVAVAYDLNRMDPEPPSINTIGGISQKEAYSAPVREVMVGLGYQEILTFSLTNKENLFQRMNLPLEEVCEIKNPISASWTAIRNWLLPSIMEFLSHNLHNQFPQKVFEVGDVSVVDESQETFSRTVRKMACARSDTRVSYEDASSDLDALLRLLGIQYSLKPSGKPFFLPGRGADILTGDLEVGCLGEIHPQVLNNWGIEKPVVAIELDLDALFSQ